jgi:hypothetical protein
LEFGLRISRGFSRGTIWIADAHRGDGRRFIVRADEKLSAFVELERQVLTVTFYLESISPSGVVGSQLPSSKDQAIDYAQNRACFRSGGIHILDSTGKLERTIRFSESDRKL